MKFFFETTFLFIFFISIAWSKKCITTDGYTCVFPFIYNHKTYDICTTDFNREMPWCATYMPYTHRYWGYCPQSCFTCGVSNSVTRSCNDGVNRYATDSDIPWHALIKRKNSQSDFFCSGVIISEQWVLTTHIGIDKLKTQYIDYLEVKVGNKDMKSLEHVQILNIEKITKHEDYNDWSIRNDIALVKTKSKFIFSHLVLPICLNVEKSKIKFGATGTVSGIKGDNMDYLLKSGGVTIYDSIEGRCSYPGVFCTKHNTYIETLYSGASVSMCLNNKCALVGLLATDQLLTSTLDTDIYHFTDVAHFIPWIYRNTI
ncbi:granzyme E isoform X1 [Lepeophtheirus salmonis]|uniref:granzyme E isoform X1 n=2 Tax=Lepeophtheirus salmonis TaxID=72036 RepID=UPI001AE858D3|nr:chymotrypsinogen B2-like isoform X1 [Lepeophtheirus salmonis]XP_040567210.1 chymotrypsinogen B2-like isoform X1 [Lepeophtheirus salmonis]XP_040567212.1 chymotrypsinogen B2-like isoform X1 [Lepeophtheirus salmonis]